MRVSTQQVPRRARRDARDNRTGILSAATETIARNPHASIDEIARNAGLSRRALYGHFDDREALVREVISAGAVRFNAIATEISAQSQATDSRVTLARLTSRLWKEASHVQVSAAVALDDAHINDTAAALAPLRSELLQVVATGQAAGHLRTDVTAPTLARLLEETARMMVTRIDPAPEPQLSLAVRTVLSVAGLSWREAADLMHEYSDLVGAN